MASTRKQVESPVLRTISDFKAKMTGGGARPNLFEVVLQFPLSAPTDTDTLQKSRFLVKAAALPASNITPIDVPFRGRTLKIAGDRTFEPWTITIQNDSNFVLRNAFELWASSIQAYNENFTAAGTLGDEDDATGYFSDMTVHQLARDVKNGDAPRILKSYKFYNVFPSNIAAIDLDFGNNDAIEEFTVELQTQYWTPIQANE